MSLAWLHDLVGQGVEDGGREPVGKFELRPFGEEDRELPALRPHPEAVLAAEGVHVRQQLARGDQLAVDPAEAEARIAARRAGHHPALPGGRDGHFGLALLIAQHDEVGVALQECGVVTKSGGGCAVRERGGCAHKKDGGNNGIAVHGLRAYERGWAGVKNSERPAPPASLTFGRFRFGSRQPVLGPQPLRMVGAPARPQSAKPVVGLIHFLLSLPLASPSATRASGLAPL